MDLIAELSQYKKVFVYGAGKAGKVAVRKIASFYPDIQLECVVVSSYSSNPYHVCGKVVVSVDELRESLSHDLSEYAVLIAVMGDCREEIRKTLMQCGFDNIYHMTEQMFTDWRESKQEHDEWNSSYWMYYKRYMEPCLAYVQTICEDFRLDHTEIRRYVRKLCTDILYSEELIMAKLIVVLGTKCSLRCKECNNLMPHFSPQRDLDLECILNSLKIILDKTEKMLCCELIGGEPFLSNNLHRVMQFLIESKKVGQIEIITNGKTMPDDAVIPLLKNRKVKVLISDYEPVVDKEKIIDLLEKNTIYYQILKMGNWISSGGVEKRFRTRIQLEKYYRECPSGYYCKTLYGDKIFACARAGSLYALNYMKEEEYVPVDENLTAAKLKDFILQDYSEACDYCDMGSENAKRIKIAEQLTVSHGRVGQ